MPMVSNINITHILRAVHSAILINNSGTLRERMEANRYCPSHDNQVLKRIPYNLKRQLNMHQPFQGNPTEDQVQLPTVV